MSAPTTVGLERTRWSAKRLLAVTSLVAALAAGILAAYVLTSTPVADTAPATTTVQQTRSGAGSCAGSQATGGGIVEGLSAGDACATAGGSTVGGGLQP